MSASWLLPINWLLIAYDMIAAATPQKNDIPNSFVDTSLKLSITNRNIRKIRTGMVLIAISIGLSSFCLMQRYKKVGVTRLERAASTSLT